MGWTLSGDYYVDAASGNDSNAGTTTAPFKTIQAAVAAAEAGGSGYQDIVVGAGTYTGRIVAATSTDYLCLKADGEVIFDASGTGDSAFYNGQYWKVDGFKIIDVAAALTISSNDAYKVTFHNCYIKNCPDWYKDISMLEQSRYHDTNCIFENVGSTNLHTSYYARYWSFTNCLFIDCWMPGYRSNGTQFSGNTYPPALNSCVVYNTSPNTIVNFWRSNNGNGGVRNCLFSENTSYKTKDNNILSGSGLSTYFTNDATSFEVNNTVASASFNTDISGSNIMSDAMFTLPGITSNKDYFQNYKLGNGRFAGTNNMATAYGYQNAASNPFHTAGGATWTNITSSTAGGLQISMSTFPTGTIESAVIDQGSIKAIRQIKTSYTSTVLGATGISVFTASTDNRYPTRQTFEMRYGNSSNLSSNEYEIFDTNLPTYIDSNGSGSGDITFDSGSSLNFPSARYLQLKFTLRTNITGS